MTGPAPIASAKALFGRVLRAMAVPLLWIALTAGIGYAVLEASIWWRTAEDNRIVAALVAGRDLEVSTVASDAVVYARLDFLLFRDRLAEAEPLVERIARSPDDEMAAEGLMAAGNARMRRALELVEAGKIDEAVPFVGVAKQRYIQGLRRQPGNWNLKFDLDVAMRLVRDFPELEVGGDEEAPATPKKLWTELPGLPRGLP